MHSSFPTKPQDISYDTPFSRNLLRILTSTIRARPNETEAEYKERYTAIVTAFAAFAPRDPVEQMLAAQLVAAQYAALDCLAQAAAAEDATTHDRLFRIHASLTRAADIAMRHLTKAQERPAATLPPPPVIETPAQPEPVTALKPRQQPMHREKQRGSDGRVFDFTRDPAKMSDEELEAAIAHAKAREAREAAAGAG